MPPPPPPRRKLTSYPGAAAAAASAYASNRLSGNWTGSEYPDTSSGGAALPANKKEEMWKRRWKRAKEILSRDGVILRTWRVGPDVMGECVGAVQKELDGIKADRLGAVGQVKRTGAVRGHGRKSES